MMSSRATRTGAVLASPLLLACGPTDETPPTIEDARFEDEATLILSFSEPIAPTDDVTPEAHFRLEVGFYLADLGYTVYYDLSSHFEGEVPGQTGAVEDEWPRHGGTEVVRVEPGDDSSELRLKLSVPLDPDICATLIEAEAIGVPASIQLHYARASAPRITDLAGNDLAEIASWWIDKAPALVTVSDGEFPELDVRTPIPCPDL